MAGKNCTAVGEMATKIAGVTKVRLADSSEYENALAENVAGLIVNMATEYSHILAQQRLLQKILCLGLQLFLISNKFQK